MVTFHFSAMPQQGKLVLDALGGERVVAVNPRLVRALKGNGNAAIFFSQLLYWAKRTKDPEGWFFNSYEDFQDQTGLGERAQRNARDCLKMMGIIEETEKGMTPKRLRIRVNLAAFLELMGGDPLETTHGAPQETTHVQFLETTHGAPQYNKSTAESTSEEKLVSKDTSRVAPENSSSLAEVATSKAKARGRLSTEQHETWNLTMQQIIAEFPMRDNVELPIEHVKKLSNVLVRSPERQQQFLQAVRNFKQYYELRPGEREYMIGWWRFSGARPGSPHANGAGEWLTWINRKVAKEEKNEPVFI